MKREKSEWLRTSGILTLSLFFFILFKNMSEAQVLEEKIRKHVEFLATDLGERNYQNHQNLERAADYIRSEFKDYGYAPQEQVYYINNQSYRNIIATKLGRDKKDRIIILCAHYDSVVGSFGADDNASGVAGLLELARLLSSKNYNQTIKFIAFVNEEPPFFMGADMGSFRYAREARKKRERIAGVLCLESIGFYSNRSKSQGYPSGLSFFYPDKGNFIAFVSNFYSQSFLKKIVKEFKKAVHFPVEYLVAPIILAPAIAFSDNWSFWKFGYKAIMITDTAFYRNPYYHSLEDTPEKLDYPRLARVIEGLYLVLLSVTQ